MSDILSAGIEEDFSALFCVKMPVLFTNMDSAFNAISRKLFNQNELLLTCKGLSCVNWDHSDPDFEFLAGDDKVLRVHSVLAEFLSPKIARLRKSDPFCCVYTLTSFQMLELFEILVSNIRTGQPLRVKASIYGGLLQLSKELENDDLFSSLLGMLNTESLNIEEAIPILRAGMDIGTTFFERIGCFGDFIASHFYEIEKQILDSLDLETFKRTEPDLEALGKLFEELEFRTLMQRVKKNHGVSEKTAEPQPAAKTAPTAAPADAKQAEAAKPAQSAPAAQKAETANTGAQK